MKKKKLKKNKKKESTNDGAPMKTIDWSSYNRQNKFFKENKLNQIYFWYRN